MTQPGATRERALTRTYHVYGIRVRSQWRLPYTSRPAKWVADIGLLRGSAARFARAVEQVRVIARDERTWRRGIRLDDGQTYLRWPDRFEFLVSADGGAIVAHPLGADSREAFHAYLLGQALSFALINQGLDPLHATTVTVDDGAVALVGESGYGKSTLGAAFLQEGHSLLTDDLLVLSSGRDGFIAHPGPPRIKLFPEIARRVLGMAARGTPLAPAGPKLLIPLANGHAARAAAPIRAIYLLSSPERQRSHTRIAIRRVSQRQACLALLRNAFNTAVTGPQRLQRQFAFAAAVAARVPVKRLTYPRTIASLTRARDAILADLSRD